MTRFFVDRDTFLSDTPLLTGENGKHASVLRLKAGEQIILCDGTGQERLCRVLSTNPGQTAVEPEPVRPASTESRVWGSVYMAYPKADKLELIAQKATELGAWEIWPVEMLRSVARLGKNDSKKQERLSRIALEAAKQSGRAHVPEVRGAVSFEKALKRLEEEPFDLILVAWEEEHALPLSKAVEKYRQSHDELKRVLIVIGPEGGIDEAEQQRLATLGAQSVTLGPRILRTETAGLCALAALWTAMGEM